MCSPAAPAETNSSSLFVVVKGGEGSGLSEGEATSGIAQRRNHRRLLPQRCLWHARGRGSGTRRTRPRRRSREGQAQTRGPSGDPPGEHAPLHKGKPRSVASWLLEGRPPLLRGMRKASKGIQECHKTTQSPGGPSAWAVRGKKKKRDG